MKFESTVKIRGGAGGTIVVPCDSAGPLTVALVDRTLRLVHRRSGLGVQHVLSRSFLPSYRYACPYSGLRFMQDVRGYVEDLASWEDEIPVPHGGEVSSWHQCIRKLLTEIRDAGLACESGEIMDSIDRRDRRAFEVKVKRDFELAHRPHDPQLIRDKVRSEFWWQTGSWWTASQDELYLRQAMIENESERCMLADLRSAPQDPRVRGADGLMRRLPSVESSGKVSA